MAYFGTTEKDPNEPDRSLVYVPWTDEQVQALNDYQHAGIMHPYTCGGSKHDGVQSPVLVATTDGWRCPDEDCSYVQGWAHGFSADPQVVRDMISERETWTSRTTPKE